MAAPQTQGHSSHSSEAGGVFALQVLRWVLTCQQVSSKSALYWWLEKWASGMPSPKSQLNHNTLLCDQDPGWAPALIPVIGSCCPLDQRQSKHSRVA